MTSTFEEYQRISKEVDKRFAEEDERVPNCGCGCPVRFHGSVGGEIIDENGRTLGFEVEWHRCLNCKDCEGYWLPPGADEVGGIGDGRLD